MATSSHILTAHTKPKETTGLMLTERWSKKSRQCRYKVNITSLTPCTILTQSFQWVPPLRRIDCDTLVQPEILTRHWVLGEISTPLWTLYLRQKRPWHLKDGHVPITIETILGLNVPGTVWSMDHPTLYIDFAASSQVIFALHKHLTKKTINIRVNDYAILWEYSFSAFVTSCSDYSKNAL